MESSKSGVSIPKWNGKQDSFARYYAKVHALAVYYDCGDAFDVAKMAKLPKKSEYDTLDLSKDPDKELAALYNANKQMCALIVLAQDSDHGLAMIQKTTTKDHPHGNAYQFMKLCTNKNRPEDTSAEIKMDTKLNKIQFVGANDYYNEVVSVQARYNVGKTDADLIKVMANEVTNETYMKLIVDHLNNPPCDMDALCTQINVDINSCS